MTPNSRHKPPLQKRDCERGAALITVLFMVAIMAALGVSLFDTVRFDLLKAKGRQTAIQGRWFAVGAEEMARKILEDSFTLSPNKTTANDPWATESGRFPIPGGFIDAQLRDGGNCFNVNSLVTLEENGVMVADEATVKQLADLIIAIGLDETTAEEVTGRLVDWVDTDGQPATRGAEDFDYLALEPAYRTPNTLMHDMTELRALKDMTTDMYDLIRPWLCALPTTNSAVINLNTLTLDQAPFIVMLTGGSMAQDTARSVLETRPAAGWGNRDEFNSLQELIDTPVTQPNRVLMDVKTQFFVLNTVVALGDVLIQLESRFDASTPNRIKLVSRQFGEET